MVKSRQVYQTWSLIGLIILSLASCDQILPRMTGYKNYTHPSLRFQVHYPAKWTLIEGGSFGTQVQFLSDSPSIFLANANIAVNRNPNLSLEALADLSAKQLTILLPNYELETKAIGTLGKHKAVDLRGVYDAAEGKRKIRSVIAIINEMQYVFTFTCEAQDEHSYAKTINKMIDSFSL
ncbi:MAG: hypothetical protein KDK51_10110 [Deltaproteobacteria bacterium]|nr:hypothetical protein [Deltaproteobacteria bacterium]